MPNYIDPRALGGLLGGVGTMTDQDYSAYGNLAAPSAAPPAAAAISDIEQLAAQSALGMKARANPYLDQAVSKADGQTAMTDQDVDELIATYGGK